MSCYLFCYGSLVHLQILSQCLELSIEEVNELMNKIIPVKIIGICRGWINNYHQNKKNNGLKLTPTYLAAYKTSNTNIYANGILILLNNEQIAKVDNRELSSCYQKEYIDPSNILYYRTPNNFQNNLPIYFYSCVQPPIYNVNENSEEFKGCVRHSYYSSKKYPIVQSYIDLCCNGFLLIDKLLCNDNYQFTRDFIQSTHYWSTYWINDRIYPYRSFFHEPNSGLINKLLEEYLGPLLESIELR